MTPTREQLLGIAREIGTVAEVLARKSVRSEDEQQAIKRLSDWRSRIFAVIDAMAEAETAAALAPQEAAPMPPSDRRADNPQVRRVYCTAGSGGGKSLMMSAAIRKANGAV